MKIHISGICGTFMASVALLAKANGIKVSGSDQNVYPPMSDVLADAGIEIFQGYAAENIAKDVDNIIFGNVISRGNPEAEYVLNKNLPYYSGPEWLANNLLRKRWVLGVAGTHGKTTTTSLLAWILEYAGLEPGFLIGGVAENFDFPARNGGGDFFVIEADEYDSAFFDKRSKFIHYHPKTAILNNLEFDHADIFADLQQIQTSFHHLVRTIPANGRIIHPAQDQALAEVLAQGCWTECQSFGLQQGEWQAKLINADGSNFELWRQQKLIGTVESPLVGEHNVQNVMAAIIAAEHAGVELPIAMQAITKFKGIKRRMEALGSYKGAEIFDDFAHHPTAIKTTLAGLRAKQPKAKILVALDFSSNTMKAGVHKDSIAAALRDADAVWLYKNPDMQWDLQNVANDLRIPTTISADIKQVEQQLLANLGAGDQAVLMSNGAFAGLKQSLQAKLSA